MSPQMSETQRYPFNLRRRPHSALCSCRLCVSGLLIAGAFVLLAFVFAFRTSTPQTDILTIKVIEHPHPRRVDFTRTAVFETESFYRTIIDNNLFRPLGWTPRRPIQPYRLIGTLLPRSANTPPRAILQTTAGNTTYIVSLGEKIDASTEVVEIHPKQVRLSRNGQQRTLKLPSGF